MGMFENARISAVTYDAHDQIVDQLIPYDAIGPADAAESAYGLGGLPMRSVVADNNIWEPGVYGWTEV